MKKSIMLTISALVMAFSLNAFSTEYYPGTQCQLGFNSSANLYYNYNRAYNDSSSFETFYCSADTNTDYGNTYVDGGISVIDASANSSVSCMLRTIDWDGQYDYNYSSKSTPTGHDSSTPYFLYFDQVSRSSAFYYTYIYCSVPGNTDGQSGVHGYYTFQG